MTEYASPDDQLELARVAATGEKHARAQVNQLVHPLIDYHTNKFCKRFCYENCRIYRCSLSKPLGSATAEALLCEWGNASYGWMLDDLTSENRLSKYKALNNASLFDYLYQIANSLPFYERWKNWRFGRRVHVPTYIQAIDPVAAQIFYALRAGTTVELIAQQTGLPRPKVDTLCRLIVNTLTKRNRLYLLDSPKTESLSEQSDDQNIAHQRDIPVIDDSIEQQDEKFHFQQGWAQLDTIQQFVLEALVINNQDTQSVLHALREMDISIKAGVPAEQADVQQLYYFKRKALAQLAGYLKNEE